MDFLGQGNSWPTRAPTREDGVCYSVDMWTEQVEIVWATKAQNHLYFVCSINLGLEKLRLSAGGNHI